jgi:hypothetical protein
MNFQVENGFHLILTYVIPGLALVSTLRVQMRDSIVADNALWALDQQPGGGRILVLRYGILCCSLQVDRQPAPAKHTEHRP